MGQLCIYLPPFASDYSGVCSVLFDLDCMTAINDASCCTGHYVFYDEPRWSKKVRPIFSTALRTMDAILGNEEKTIDSICEAAERLDSPMVAFVGTPVPAIIGMDTKGMAAQIESRTGRPSFGFDTTGFSYYDKGIALAGKTLFDRFAVAPEQLGATRMERANHRRVNVLGITPLDFGDVGTDTALVRLLNEAGWEVNCLAFMDMDLEDVRAIGAADVNLAVSSAGVALADHLRTRFGTPYVAGLPLGESHARVVLERLDRAVSGGSDAPSSQVGEAQGAGAQVEEVQRAGAQRGEAQVGEAQRVGVQRVGAQREETGATSGRVLIVADQVIGASLREALSLAGLPADAIDVASFFGWHKNEALPGDVALKSEAQYLKLIASGRYRALIADPLLTQVPQAQKLVCYSLTHPAVSSRLHWADVPHYCQPTFQKELQAIASLL